MPAKSNMTDKEVIERIDRMLRNVDCFNRGELFVTSDEKPFRTKTVHIKVTGKQMAEELQFLGSLLLDMKTMIRNRSCYEYTREELIASGYPEDQLEPVEKSA